jgi:predicted transporter
VASYTSGHCTVGGGGYFTTDGRSVSQSVCLGIEHPCGTCDQILLLVGMLLSEICGLVSVGRPL